MREANYSNIPKVLLARITKLTWYEQMGMVLLMSRWSVAIIPSLYSQQQRFSKQVKSNGDGLSAVKDEHNTGTGIINILHEVQRRQQFTDSLTVTLIRGFGMENWVVPTGVCHGNGSSRARRIRHHQTLKFSAVFPRNR